MDTKRHPVRALSLTALRVGVGVTMATHGWVKLTDMGEWTNTVEGLGAVPWPGIASWLAVAGELLGGLGLIVGLLTPVAAFGVLAVMVTAIATVHWGNGLLAANNGFELPLTLGLVALHFMVRGGGPISLDAAIAAVHRRAQRREEKREPEKPGAPPMKPAEATS